MKKTYKIEVDCIGCAGKKLIVEFAQGADPAEVMPRMQKNCKKVAHDCEIFL